ncbi:DUF397 domain-containing protein [Streptomyces sp. 4F14]|uniref:DUF397 domain-containing protein n=1 Tax=Streptomyces sp. 4F14 TaxID=3394380 RepID=UPI003A87DFBB
MTTVHSLRWVKSSHSDNGGNCVEVALWVKSSYSDNGGDCVEVALGVAARGLVPVRDSKAPEGPVLGFSSPAFASFTAGVKDGQFTA